jgi:hypothetical protein
VACILKIKARLKCGLFNSTSGTRDSNPRLTGDADEKVPVMGTRTWMETMKELQMNYEYKEYPWRVIAVHCFACSELRKSVPAPQANIKFPTIDGLK